MEEAFRAALHADAGVKAVAGDRLDWGLRPPQLPAGRMQVVSEVPFYTAQGRDGLTPYRVQIDCMGLTYGDAKRLARAIVAAVGRLGRPAFDACFIFESRDDHDEDASGRVVFRTSLDVRVWHHSS